MSLFLFLSAVTLVTRQANRIARVLRSITKLRKASRKWERMSQRSAKDKNRLGSDNVSASAYSGFRLYEERESDRCATGSVLPVRDGCTGGQAASGALPVGRNMA